MALTDPDAAVELLVADGASFEAGDGAGPGHRECPRRAAGRARRPEPGPADERHRHPDGGVRRACGRHRGPDHRHPQDDAGAARAGTLRRAVRRRRQPPLQPLRRRAGQGQPPGRAHRGRPGAADRRCSGRPGRSSGTRRTSRWRWTGWTRSNRCWPPAWTPSCWTTSRRPSCAAGVALVAGRARVEASGNVNLATVAAIAAAGVDVISIGALTHSVARPGPRAGR